MSIIIISYLIIIILLKCKNGNKIIIKEADIIKNIFFMTLNLFITFKFNQVFLGLIGVISIIFSLIYLSINVEYMDLIDKLGDSIDVINFLLVIFSLRHIIF